MARRSPHARPLLDETVIDQRLYRRVSFHPAFAHCYFSRCGRLYRSDLDVVVHHPPRRLHSGGVKVYTHVLLAKLWVPIPPKCWGFGLDNLVVSFHNATSDVVAENLTFSVVKPWLPGAVHDAHPSSQRLTLLELLSQVVSPKELTYAMAARHDLGLLSSLHQLAA